MAKKFIRRVSLILLLLGGPSAGMVSASAATFSEIQFAQQELQTLGYQPGKADGLMGPRTRAAIKKFQRDSSLPTTGTLGPRTKAQLLQAMPGDIELTGQRRRPGYKKQRRTATRPLPGSVLSSPETTGQVSTPGPLRRRPGGEK